MVVGNKDKRGRKKEKEGRGFGRLPFFLSSFFVGFSHDCLIWVMFVGPNLVFFLRIRTVSNSCNFES